MHFVRDVCFASDVHFVRDVCFASDVRFAREDAEHITSLCDEGAKHHCALALHHYGEAATSLKTSPSGLEKHRKVCYNKLRKAVVLCVKTA